MKKRIVGLVVYGCLFFVVIVFSMIVDRYRKKQAVLQLEKLPGVSELGVQLPRNRRQTIYSIIFSIPIILLPCLLAGVRGETVGFDIKVYAEAIFKVMRRAPSVTYIFNHALGLEPGYALLAYISAKLSGRLSVFLFMTELVMVLPIYIVAYRRSPRIPIASTMTVYLMVFYLSTFNIMRQSMSAAILLLAYQMYTEKKYGWAAAISVLAFTFHSSAFIGIAVYLAAEFLVRKEKRYDRLLMKLGIIFVVCLVILSVWTVFAKFLIQKQLVPERYSTYLSIFTGNVPKGKQYYFTIILDDVFSFLCHFLAASVLLVFGKNTIKKNSLMTSYLCTYVLSFIVYAIVFVVMHSTYGMRIIWNTDFVLILAMPEVLAKTNKQRDILSLRNVLAAGAVLIYFSGYMVFGWHGVMPFYFSFK